MLIAEDSSLEELSNNYLLAIHLINLVLKVLKGIFRAEGCSLLNYFTPLAKCMSFQI